MHMEKISYRLTKKLKQEINQKIILACAKDNSHTLQLSSSLG